MLISIIAVIQTLHHQLYREHKLFQEIHRRAAPSIQDRRDQKPLTPKDHRGIPHIQPERLSSLRLAPNFRKG